MEVAAQPFDAMEGASCRSLTGFCRGCRVRLLAVEVEGDEADRLREMGLREGRQVCILQNSDNVIVRAGYTRIGMHRDLAAMLFGTEVAPAEPAGFSFGRLREILRQSFRAWNGGALQAEVQPELVPVREASVER